MSMIYSGPPPLGTPIPDAVRKAAAGDAIHPVWLNQLGGLTFRLGEGAGRRFAKWMPAGSGSPAELGAEAARLRWASPYVTVPPVLEEGTDELGSWLITAGIAGEYAVADRWKQDPATTVAEIGDGLRAFHDALPVADCPFSWSVEARLAEASEPRPEAAQLLADQPPPDRLVVCHGDSCAPNTLLGDDGRWTGHVDLGQLGVADRWADLAIATWSVTLNYGPGWETALLDAYGVEEDPERTAYYRRVGNTA